MTKACVVCTQDFEAKLPHALYCGIQCKKNARNKRVTDKRPTSLKTPKPCKICNELFLRTHATQAYCLSCLPESPYKRGRKNVRSQGLRYRINHADRQLIIDRFDGMCWICRDKPMNGVDHDHSTGEVRGVLCRGCNMALHFVERPGWWESARNYLEGGGLSAYREEQRRGPS